MFDILWYPSPNCNDREGKSISCIVMHNTAGSAEGALATLSNPRHDNPKAAVSCHYLVGRNARVYQLVDDTKCAWHAGNRTINKKSLGIEIEAYTSQTGFTPQQELATIALVRWLTAKYNIPASSIIMHREVPDVKTACPGFLWAKAEDFQEWKERYFV